MVPPVHPATQEVPANLDLQDLLDLLVIPVKMGNPDQLVYQVTPAKTARTVILVDQDRLDQLDIPVNQGHPDIPEQRD